MHLSVEDQVGANRDESVCIHGQLLSLALEVNARVVALHADAHLMGALTQTLQLLERASCRPQVLCEHKDCGLVGRSFDPGSQFSLTKLHGNPKRVLAVDKALKR